MDIKSMLERTVAPQLPGNQSFRIGIVGAGFIVRDCHLVAYEKLGFNPRAIAALTPDECRGVADRFHIPTVHLDWKALVDDDEIEILDIAVPPHVQLDIVRYAVKKPHIKGILCQKPSALHYGDALEIARLAGEWNKPIGINSNMRYDQSMRALKAALNEGLLGKPVLMSFEQRAIPHWQGFAQAYDRLTFINFSIHLLDIFRYLFGDPEYVTAHCRPDPRLNFPHTDGIVQYTYQYGDGLIATSMDDTYAYPQGCEKDTYINWRAEGLDGFAKGTIGWPRFPEPSQSTMELSCRARSGEWIRPEWDTCWFPDAFGGTMASLLRAVEDGTEPEISAKDHAKTIACAEACYRSVKERRSVALSELLRES